MHAAKKAALLWSGGKDSALALVHANKNHPGIQIIKLVTCVSQAYDRVSMHGVRRKLIEEQADALGFPVVFVVIPQQEDPTCPMAHTVPGTTFPPNDVYTRTILEGWTRLKDEGIEVIVFGDIFLEDLRAFRDRLLTVAGLDGCYPLWGRDTRELYDEFTALGFKGITVCVDTKRLSADHCGQLLTPAFRDSLPGEVDPCGERGEYHSFTFDGPLFAHPVSYRIGEVHRHDPFAFQELYPVDPISSRSPTATAGQGDAGRGFADRYRLLNDEPSASDSSPKRHPDQCRPAEDSMTTRTIALCGLILLAAMTRLLPHPPNFAPITAMAVFGAIRYGSRRTAVIAPLLALLLSDLARELLYRQGLAQQWGLYRGMWVVYGTTALIVLMGRLAHGTRSPVTIAATTLVGSCVFYLVTNFSVWASGTLYPPTAEGLATCYTAAIPFFRNALLGDFTYAGVLFGGWALAEARFRILRSAPTPALP